MSFIKILILFLFNIYLSFNIYSIDLLKGGCESDFPPYNFYQNKKLVGIDTEIVNLVLNKLGVYFTVETYPWSRVILLLQKHEIDFAWQFVETTERKKEFNLAGPIR
jgi:polar amino acid transport system substrate-binding protein